jgi:hypothetical protein
MPTRCYGDPSDERPVVRSLRIAVLMGLLLAACGGGADTTTTAGGDDVSTTAAAAATTTSAATATTADEGDGPVIGLDELPQECLDALAGFLREIEPIVEPIDWENATMADFEELGQAIDTQTQAYEDEITGAGCEEIDVEADDEETFQFMIDFAESEAPGTVGYLEWVKSFVAMGTDTGTGTDVSGDCETDIAAVQAVVDEGGTMAELPLTEVARVGGLVGSISMACSSGRAAEFFSQADVAAFLESSG